MVRRDVVRFAWIAGEVEELQERRLLKFLWRADFPSVGFHRLPPGRIGLGSREERSRTPATRAEHQFPVAVP